MTSSLTDKLFDNKMMAVSQNWIDWQFILVLFNAAPPPNKNKKSWGKKEWIWTAEDLLCVPLKVC